MKYKTLIVALSIFVLINGVPMFSRELKPEPIATFSIVAWDPEYREFGVAVQSKFLAVGSGVPFAAADIGALATQAWGNISYGWDGMELLKLGVDAETTVRVLTGKDEFRDLRQLGVIDASGRAAAFTGQECQDWAGHKTGKNYTVQGNILAGKKVVDDMADTFEETAGLPLAERLIAVLRAGQAAGGDIRGRQSAAILVVREAGGYSGQDDKAIDLRVDDHPDPIEELHRIYNVHIKTFGLVSYLQSSTAFEDQKDVAAAEACLKRALKITETLPDIEAHYLNAVAWTLAEKNLELDRALKLADKAVQKEPKSPEIMDTLATLYYLRGYIEQAVEWQMKAVELKPGDAYYSDKLKEWQKQLD